MAHTNILLESGTNELEIVEFFIDEEGYRGYFGVNVAKVVEIIRMQPITSMPEMSHPAIMGAFKHRDKAVIPMIDLARFLNKTRVETEPPKLIITHFNDLTNAFLVSGVTRIHRMSWEDIEPPNRFLEGLTNSSITGTCRLEDRVVFILDLEKIIGDLSPDMAIHLHDKLQHEKDRVYTILHADDSTMVRKMVKAMLEGSGRFNLVQAKNGREALEWLVEHKEMADRNGADIRDYVQGVITDIEMPAMDGHTLCRKIKEDPVLRELPVGLFSSLVSPELRHKGEAVGADYQFTKPDLKNMGQTMIDIMEGRSVEQV
jgi:two-component system chemotaxis response regulator CheV